MKKPGKRYAAEEGGEQSRPALLDVKEAEILLVKPIDLGIDLQDASPDGMLMGTWYAVKDNPGIYVSVVVPGGIAPEILRSYSNVVSGLDRVEAGELVYLVAFNLDRFDLKYALGTEHPKVNWLRIIFWIG